MFDNLENLDREIIVAAAIGFITFQVLTLILSPLSNIISDNYLIKASRDLKIDVFRKLHALDFEYHSNRRVGSLISAIKRGDSAYWSYNLEILRNMLKILLDLVFISIIFFSLDSLLSLVVFGSFMVNLFVTILLIRLNVKARSAFNDEDDKIASIIGDNLINFETVKVFAKEDKEAQRLIEQHKPWTKALWGYANSFRVIEIWSRTFSLISLVLIVLVSLNAVDRGDFSVGDFALVITFSFNFFPKLNELIFTFRELAKQQTDISKYLGILDEEETVKEKTNASTLKNVKGKIDFNNVSFNYANRSTVVSDINIHIRPNESVALVGRSGAGKTTLVKLLLRYYDVSQGSIEIDNNDIRDVTKKSLRSNIGIVPQEALLFNNTIGFNIAYGKDDASLDEIKHAARLANLDEFIESLPDKYGTIVGERGIKLSGGQKQRLAIARMVIEDPEIIVFDEATSQLDSESEKVIQDSFWKLARNKTTVIIAHRLSTIMRADRIIVLDSGKIVEEGSHKELIGKNKGIYRNLWNLQTGVLNDK